MLNVKLSLKREKKPFGKRTGANFGVFLVVKKCGGVLNVGAVTKKFLSVKDAKNGILKMN